MRKLSALVLTITLLLAGCGGPAGETPEDAAAAVQDAYREAAGCAAVVDLTAEYGEKVYDFTLDVTWQREGETVLTVTAPELLAGITARVAQGETVLEYDGAGLSLGALDPEGLTPVSAVTALLRQAAEGYAAQCSWTGEADSQLQILFRDPEKSPGTGTEFLMIFDRACRAPVRAEISSGGTRVLTAQFRDFTFTTATEMTG